MNNQIPERSVFDPVSQRDSTDWVPGDGKTSVLVETPQKNSAVIPQFNSDGNLPPGVYWAKWEEFATRFGTTPHRQQLLRGLKFAIDSLSKAGCKVIYIDGSFVTKKENPNDFDGCWDIKGVDPEILDPILLDLNDKREKQKAKYQGELFPASYIANGAGKNFLEFFQIDRKGKPKGIVAINLGGF